MTIGIGFTCQDSIVLCSERQITYGGSHKRYERKIFSGGTSSWSVAFSYAGDPGMMKSVCDEFSVAMEAKAVPFTVEVIRKQIAETLLNLKAPEEFYMLCGIVIPSREMKLLRTEAGRISSVVDGSFIGIADTSILSYLYNLLAQSATGTYSARQAELIGRYVVLQAKNWIDGCGGETDVIILRSDGRIEPSPRFPAGVEAHLAIIERHISQLAEAFFDERITAQDFDTRLDGFSKAIKEKRLLL